MSDPTILEDAKASGAAGFADTIMFEKHELVKFAQLREARIQQSQVSRDVWERIIVIINDNCANTYHATLAEMQIRALIEPLSAEASQQNKPVEFLLDGARFKLSFNEDGVCHPLDQYADELSGRWVALVPAENDKHLKMVAFSESASTNEKDAKDAARYRYLKENCVQNSDEEAALYLVVPHSVKFGAATWSDDIDAALSATQEKKA